VLHTALAEDAGFIRRFRSEAQLAASLNHPNVTAVFDWGEDEGVPFMVLELLKGGSLRGLLDAGHRLTPAQATHLGRQVAAALRYAHTRGLVHRDVKPANLLFDEHGIVRVADFGLARALAEASWTEPSGTVVGTARYAAPEQASAGAVDGRADLYSLAVVLVEASTGDVPVVRDSAIGTLVARTKQGIVAPPELGRLGPVVERAGRPEPADRYPDAAAMGNALVDAARSLPAPEPFRLAGLGDGVDDVDPTHLGRATAAARLPDDNTRPGDDTAGKEAVPLAIMADERPRFRRSAVPVVVGLAVVAALVAGAIGLAGALSGGGAPVAVPTLVGQDERQAAAAATDAGLLMQVTERRTADDPPGLVIEQKPAPGAFLGEGGEIGVVVSRGPPPVAVPDVAGRPVSEAQTALEQADFMVAVERRYDENIPVDVVLQSDPAGGGQAPRESTVTLVVSDGPAPVPVPDVAGATFEEATAALANARLEAVRQDAFSDTVEAGRVIGTDPPAGQAAARDSRVGVIVSKGPELVAVPALRGMTIEEASAALNAVGLSPDVEDYGPGKRVRAQDPDPGTQVTKGSKVTLFL
jgi:eukaryotic-like serine/threonine-protein kinase